MGSWPLRPTAHFPSATFCYLPMETLNETAVPCATDAPAAGEVLITLPAGTVVLWLFETPPAVRPAAMTAALAFAVVMPAMSRNRHHGYRLWPKWGYENNRGTNWNWCSSRRILADDVINSYCAAIPIPVTEPPETINGPFPLDGVIRFPSTSYVPLLLVKIKDKLLKKMEIYLHKMVFIYSFWYQILPL